MLRTAAAFVLLMLRPSMIVLGVALLNDFSDAHASIQYIDDDLEAHLLHPSRQTWSREAPAKAHFPTPVFALAGQHFLAPTASQPISAPCISIALNARSIRAASRSPPL